MNSPIAHLAPEAAKQLELPLEERAKICLQDRWVGYTRAMDILGQLDRLMMYPRSLRMPNIMVVGRSGNGKSALSQRFVQRHPPHKDESGRLFLPIVNIEIPGTPDESELWSVLLWQLLVAHNVKDRASSKLAQVKQVLSLVRARVLVLDEFNNISRAGKQAGDLLASIKNLSNELKLSVAAFGTQEAMNALNLDPQMRSRFDPAVLDRWKHDREYRRFLATYERMLPLEQPSNLADAHLSGMMFDMAGETIGGTVKLLKKAAEFAVRQGVERITPDVLQSIEWTRANDWDAVARQV